MPLTDIGRSITSVDSRRPSTLRSNSPNGRRLAISSPSSFPILAKRTRSAKGSDRRRVDTPCERGIYSTCSVGRSYPLIRGTGWVQSETYEWLAFFMSRAGHGSGLVGVISPVGNEIPGRHGFHRVRPQGGDNDVYTEDAMSREEWYLLDRTGAASLLGQPLSRRPTSQTKRQSRH